MNAHTKLAMVPNFRRRLNWYQLQLLSKVERKSPVLVDELKHTETYFGKGTKGMVETLAKWGFVYFDRHEVYISQAGVIALAQQDEFFEPTQGTVVVPNDVYCDIFDEASDYSLGRETLTLMVTRPDGIHKKEVLDKHLIKRLLAHDLAITTQDGYKLRNRVLRQAKNIPGLRALQQ